jgi:hypothetical protein
MTGTPVPGGGTFPFERLPLELRLRIIGFTDIAPLNYNIPVGDQLGVEAPDLWFSDDGPSPKHCCRRCTETTKDCCCPSRRAAYSKGCTCRRIPLELALVNKLFYHDVTEVLFSQNIFQFGQDPEKTISFFRHLPSRSLRLIRRVEYQFSEDEVECWQGSHYGPKWRDLITYLKNNLDLPSLSIIVSFDTWELATDNEHEEINRSIYDIYRQVTKALRMLDGACSVRFALCTFIALEPLMENAVMGEGYVCRNSEARVPLEERHRFIVGVPNWHKPSDFTE